MRISDWSSDVGSSDLVLPIPPELMHGDYEHDAEFRARFQAWINTLWARKDERLERQTNARPAMQAPRPAHRSEEHTSELQSLIRNSYAVFCWKKKNNINDIKHTHQRS